jgi:ABC-type multidrug transport system ATPase subunit
VYSTHIVAEAERYARRVIVLDQGTLLFDGPPTELARVGGTGDFEQAFVSFLRERGRA